LPADRLLVIDDSREARDFLEEFLVFQGYTVLTAKDGEEGLHRALHDGPDVILLDMQMPKLTGIEVIEALNREGRDIPVIFLTAYGSEELAVQAIRAGARDYVPKPCEPQVIQASVERALRDVHLRKEHNRLTTQLSQANEALQRQLQELNAINAIGKSVTSLLDLEQVLTRVVEAATFLARAEEGSLMLLDDASGELYLRATKNVDEIVARGLRIRVDDSLAGRVVSTGRPVLLSGEGLTKIATTYLVKSLLMVPLQAPDSNVIGVLIVDNQVSSQAFGDHDLRMLTAMANYATTAIHNASLVESLQSEKNKTETVLRETSEAVLVMDDAERVLLCNRAALSAFDLKEGSVIGYPLREVLPNQELTDLLARHEKAGIPVQAELALDDGRTLHASVSAIKGVGLAIVMHDITHLKEVDRIKSEFVSAISHDLRTPLTTIQGYVDLLPRAGPLNQRQHEFLTRVQRSLSSVSDLVSDLLDITRIETGADIDMVPTDLKAIVEEVVLELTSELEAKQHDLQTHLPESLSPIMGNPRRLRQVISNLVGNAIKYTPKNGVIELEAAEGEDHVMVAVRDNGLGIPAADQPYVFDKFFRVDQPETRDIPGTGLGLAIVKSVVEGHGGRVWVESEPGQGSAFILLLPKT
jgi:signal transduction histidine kinase/DNA-binding response OmpR family regulator